MKKKQTPDNLFQSIKSLVDETDIRVLVFGSYITSFGGLIVWTFIMIQLTNDHIYQPLSYIAVGIASLIAGISGIFEVYKKEMPGPFGKVVKGKVAVFSGVLLIILFDIGGVSLLIYGLISLLSKG